MASSRRPKSVLFVCLGNICRSPIAEAVFLDLIRKRGVENEWLVDSAAIIDYHTGNNPDKRARNLIKKYGIDYTHKARQICEEDFSKFQFIFGMDDNNITEINENAPSKKISKIELLGSYDPEGDTIIEDPYYESGDAGFEKAYRQCVRCCNAFLDKNL